MQSTAPAATHHLSPAFWCHRRSKFFRCHRKSSPIFPPECKYKLPPPTQKTTVKEGLLVKKQVVFPLTACSFPHQPILIPYLSQPILPFLMEFLIGWRGFIIEKEKLSLKTFYPKQIFTKRFNTFWMSGTALTRS